MWMEDSTTENIRARIDNKIKEDPEHATEVFSALWKIANEDDSVANKVRDTETPSVPPPDVSIFWFCLTACVMLGYFID